MVTSIRISDETWNELMKKKKTPSDTFDKIIRELLEGKR